MFELHVGLGPGLDPVLDVGKAVDVVPEGREVRERLDGLVTNAVLQSGHNHGDPNVGVAELKLHITGHFLKCYGTTMFPLGS